MSTSEQKPHLDDAAMAAEIVRFAHDKKAVDVVELDLRGLVDYTDRFVIASGRSDRQVKAIHDGILVEMKKEFGLYPRKVEGLPEGRWVLIDFIDVVVHVFQPEAREMYRLEKLWGDADRTDHADVPDDLPAI
jgi:ribosome-associated protein